MSQASTKRAISLSLDADLVGKPRACGVNVSAVADEASRVRTDREEAQAWLDENREAVAAQNAWMTEREVFSDEFRG